MRTDDRAVLERDGELAAIGRLLDGARRGSGSVVVLEGPAGIGKSELLDSVLSRARASEFGALAARGSEFEAEMAFGVVCQLFEPMLRAAEGPQRRDLLRGVAGVGARVLGIEAGEPPPDRFAAIHGLYWLCANRCERGPVLVAVDDLQWVDDPSLAWLGYLGRRARDLPLLLVGCLRSGDPGGHRGELERILTEDGVERIALQPLSEAGVAQIVRARLGEHAEEPFCAACSELTGGNALFVHELLAAARTERLAATAADVPALRLIAPSAVGTSVLGRLGRLGSEAVALARAVAILGGEAEVAVAARLAELDPELAELAADRLAAAQIFAAVRPLEFSHPVLGAAVREDMAPGARRLAHRRAATLLEDAGSPARVATHLLACAPAADPWVVERLVAAARQTLEHGAPEVAVTLLRRALSEPPAAADRPGVLLLLGLAGWRAGDQDAIANLEQARATAGEDQGTFLGASIQLATAYLVSGQGAVRAIEVLEDVLAEIGDGNPDVALTIEAGAALVGILSDRTAPAAFERAEALRDRLDGPPSVYLLVLLANCAAREGRAEEARDLAERAMACEPYPPPFDIALGLIAPLTLIEGYDLLDRFCADLFDAASARGAVQEMVVVCGMRASAAANRGLLADADADARWALARAGGMFRMQAASELARVLIERDRLDQAAHELEQLAGPTASRSVEVARFLLVRARLRAAQGRLEEALDDLL